LGRDRSGRLPGSDVTVVHFTATDRQLAQVDVALGPCVAAGSRRRPLVSPLREDRGEGPEQMQALFMALTGRPGRGLLCPVADASSGRLARYSQAFADALADTSQRMVSVAADPDAFMAMVDEIDRAWMAAAK
jgi:hypothetical protein